MADQFDYVESKADADDLIAEFGQACVLVVPGQTTGPAFDPTSGDPILKDAMIVVIEYEDRQIDGSRILATDQRGLMAVGNLDVAPDPVHKLEIGGKTLTIVRVKPLAPAGIPVLYDIQMRRA